MNYYKQIKTTLISNEAYKTVKDYSKNRSDLRAYYEVGRLLVEAQGGETRAKYGNQLIKEYAQKLTDELGKGYTVTNLKYMRQFYLFVKKGHAVRDQLSWTHYRILMQLTDDNKIEYYIEEAIRNIWSYRELQARIKNQDYERLPSITKRKLSDNRPTTLQDSIKNPIIIKNNSEHNEISEKILQQLILEDLPHFLSELGEGFAFINNECKIKIGDNYHYIDLLLGNLHFNCYVVVELKITEFKAEYIGQIQKYMNYVDKNLKSPFQDDTIGIIIAKRGNKFVLEYCSDPRVKVVEWRLN